MPKTIKSVYCPKCGITIERPKGLRPFKDVLFEHFFNYHKMNGEYYNVIKLKYNFFGINPIFKASIIERMNKYIEYYDYNRVDSKNFENFIYLPEEVDIFIKQLNNYIEFTKIKRPEVSNLKDHQIVELLIKNI